MPYHILLVDPDVASRAGAEDMLTRAGYHVRVASSLADAVREMAGVCPDALITAVRLGAFNGLQLILRYHRTHPDLRLFLLGEQSDAALEPEARQYGALFVKKPLEPESFLRLVAGSLGGVPYPSTGGRRWPRKRAELEANVAHVTARAVELSYGGLRLEFPDRPTTTDAPVEVELPSVGWSGQVVPKWTMPSRDAKGHWWCGAEVASPQGSRAARIWRRLVDSLKN